MFVQSTSAVLPAFRAEPPFSMVSARAEGWLEAAGISEGLSFGAFHKLKARQLLHYRPSRLRALRDAPTLGVGVSR
jgi:hypothetical protein